ncbi:tungstate transporter permease [candidate division WOR-1 bacterium RIFOXYA12_FULL_43_27]|uniref:Tungstate transporter permease n=1 Tax=candidate division WOR-1 bacterium RIFOXYC2_FULL_46_14 TaxID=1802587 RepID=A0A1F4U5F3_UNCSA|nr:MAG: tungstate transporter permease [candidate division WOR-1 bacterium RIFOXYA12_FULL_43_27]OGC20352.1 MAG: tungstate transporter permease [candidate division WOR-1 bacterium RIFOXYB2_FULL_46_45]OGC31911.1 MAG: tungstate transporter permease [candidate division WOR-1 bacterium RIFOXYA2_FULL_46_56]OGC40198.1 MAG: tungstate transporter permease [candidate division WOR-1 bacterium RIFOXYC2_FULL_46_14]
MQNNFSDIIAIILLTLRVSGSALLISVIIGISLGFFVALREFPGRKILIGLINTGMGLPPVVVGLLVMIVLWRAGPLGFLEWIYSPIAMIIAQVILATPIIAGLTLATIQQVPQKMIWQAKALGASGWNLLWLLIRETRLSLLAAVMAGFGGIISEVGAVMMVGGNIRGETRVMTTAIVLEAQKGNINFALILGGILLVLSFSVNFGLTLIQQKVKKS